MIETVVASDVWERAIPRIQANLSGQTFDTWFRSMTALEFDGRTLLLEVPSPFYVDWLDQHYRTLIESSLSAAIGSSVGVSFQVRSEPETHVEDERSRPGPGPAYRDESHLIPQNTFDTFIVGNGNQFAHAVCQAVATSPGTRYNPLFLYGGVGLGKTHLMHAIGHQVRLQRPGSRIFFVSAEKFMNEMIYSIQHATTLEFKARYRTADILLIDDIQFLAGKESTQEEFFHTFNALHDQKKQIVLTSDGPPNAMTALQARLVSRFTWGVVADLQAPDLETRVAIVKKKAEMQGRNLPNEIALLLASNIKTNIRDLEGSLARLLAFSDLTNQPLSVEFAQEVLREQIKPDLQRVDVQEIQRLVARHFSVTEESLRGKRRTDTIAFPRQIGMYITRTITDLSLAEIGAKFGGRDHTTVMHACQKIEGLMSNDKEIRKTVEELIGVLNG
ncbi:MAG TPA: chromosomal replication initiator protein DnaA [Candidatus Eisenbacteria bacterium]|nr:chromosomal replication initiator protein DnaA [Candidatus Eisenbacteria bacterium]